MDRFTRFAFQGTARAIVGASLLAVLGACADEPTGAEQLQATSLHPAAPALPPAEQIAAIDCVAVPQSRSVSCLDAKPVLADGEPADVFSGQNTFVQLASTGSSYVGTTFSMNVTLTNLMNEAIGTPNGTLTTSYVGATIETQRADSNGIRVFFSTLPTVTGGTGTITIANADGTDTFTASNQPFYRYSQVLAKNVTSNPKSWQFNVPNTVTSFTFRVYVSTEVQRLLVINEVLSNPGGTISDANGEWFELYNAGSRAVELQGLFVADSQASGRRPYHLISSSLIIPPGGYVVLGNTTNTTNNGGVPVDYAYGAALALANSLDAIKISRVYGADTLTIDVIKYASAAVSAQNGISRELKNPALDNTDMDGANWADALVTAVYGPGGRGTPKAQNSTFTP